MYFKSLLAACIFSFISFFSLNLFALDSFVRVRVLSSYSLEQIQIQGTLLKLTTVHHQKREEFILPPEISLTVLPSGSEVHFQLGSGTQKTTELWVEAPRGTFVSLQVGEKIKRRFVGRLQIRSIRGALVVIEELPREEYVRGVLQAVIAAGFPLETLKAQAVLIRTFAWSHHGEHQKEGYDFCDSAHCQIYRGFEFDYPSFEKAVKETSSVLLTYEWKPIEKTLHHLTCGGHTSAFHEVFGGKPIPYLMGVSDEKFCERSPHFRWEALLSLIEIEEVLKKEKEISSSEKISEVVPFIREEGGRIFTLGVYGKKKSKMNADSFVSLLAKYLGFRVQSNWFEVTLENGQAHFEGKGAGLGVGFCQWGARGMAEAGKKFDEILVHYFPKTYLMRRE